MIMKHVMAMRKNGLILLGSIRRVMFILILKGSILKPKAVMENHAQQRFRQSSMRQAQNMDVSLRFRMQTFCLPQYPI